MTNPLLTWLLRLSESKGGVQGDGLQRPRALGFNPDWLLVVLLLILAAATRLYQLGSFPYFPVPSPWNGSAVYPGLYTDEAARLGEIALFPHQVTAYEPSIQIILVKLAQVILGPSIFADRLTSALGSILTSVIVYFAAKLLYKDRVAAVSSSLYFIAMVPAIIYGRMIFYENLVALFLVVTIICMAKFEEGRDRRWLYFGALSSVFAVFSKVDGLFVPVFFTAWLLSDKDLRGKVKPLSFAWAPLVAGGVADLILVGSLGGFLGQWGLGVTGRELSIEFMAIQTLPSATFATVGPFFRPEFWYLFSYLCLGVLIVKGSKWGRLFLTVLVSFFILDVSIWGIESYFLIALFPVMALSVGGGIRSLWRVGNTGALALYGVLYAPLVGLFIGSISSRISIVDYPMFFLKEALFAAPFYGLAVALLFARSNHSKRMPLAASVLACFLGLLVLGSPWLYSYYFLI